MTVVGVEQPMLGHERVYVSASSAVMKRREITVAAHISQAIPLDPEYRPLRCLPGSPAARSGQCLLPFECVNPHLIETELILSFCCS
jgi:hypothetical protein